MRFLNGSFPFFSLPLPFFPSLATSLENGRFSPGYISDEVSREVSKEMNREMSREASSEVLDYLQLH
jgi:hypothetical protein